jgi:hypothetical protein
MAVSTVPAAKAALVTLIEAALTGVSVTWSAPTDEEDYVAEMVWLGDVEHTDDWGALGRQRIDETYELEIVVQVYQEGDNAQACEERAWVLREGVVTAVRADLTLGGILNKWAGTFPTRMETRPADKGWLAKGTLRLPCRARI